MADSVTTDLLNRGVPKISLYALPAEMLWSIFSHSSLLTLMGLSTTCSILRYQLHEFFAARISSQAKKYPEVKQSLERIGWKEKHNCWDCNCFKMIGGPLFTWSELGEDWSFPSSSFLVEDTTTVAGKIFFVTFFNEIRYRQIASDGGTGQNSLHTLISCFDDAVTSFGLNLASYDNVLAFSAKKRVPPRAVTVSIFNATTLVNVSEMNVGYDETDLKVINAEVTLSRDTMVVCLDFFIPSQRERESKFQIWKLNTQDPEAEGIALLYILSHDTAPLSKKLYTNEAVCFNNRFVVIFDVVVKVFGKSESNPRVSEIAVGNKSLKALVIQGGMGDHLAVALRSFNGKNVTVKVYSASRGELIVEKEIHRRPPAGWSPSVYMEWFGDHLILGCQQDNTLVFFSWQPELASFLSSPCRVPVARRSPRRNAGNITTCRAHCLHIDFQGLTSAVYGRNGMVNFKAWKSSF